MPDNPNAEIVAIGTEILLGEITDSNSVFLARQLRDIGVNVFFMTTVGDNLSRIAEAISAALGPRRNCRDDRRLGSHCG